MDIINDLWSNLVGFFKSLPTIVIALLIIALILHLLGITVRGIIKTIVCSFIISAILGAFGIRLPSIGEIWNFITMLFDKFLEFVSYVKTTFLS